MCALPASSTVSPEGRPAGAGRAGAGPGVGLGSGCRGPSALRDRTASDALPGSVPVTAAPCLQLRRHSGSQLALSPSATAALAPACTCTVKQGWGVCLGNRGEGPSVGCSSNLASPLFLRKQAWAHSFGESKLLTVLLLILPVL